MTVTKALKEDIDEISQLYDEVIETLSGDVNYPGWIKGEYPARKTAEQGIRDGDLFILRLDGKIAGTIVLSHRPANAYRYANWGIEADYKEIIVIHTLAVHPDYVRRGIAKKLMNFAREYAAEHGMKAIRLDTSVRNKPAIALYKKCGYKYIGTVDLELGISGLVWFRLFELIL